MHNKMRFINNFLVIHIGWKKLQDNEALVKPDERKDLYPHQALYLMLEEKIKTFRHQPD